MVAKLHAWEKSASFGNSTSGFRYAGIIPFKKDVLSAHVFLISDNKQEITEIETNAPSVIDPQP